MIDKQISLDAVTEHINNNDIILVGGFGLTGCPLALLEEISKSGLRNLTIVSEDMGYTNDTFYSNAVVGLLQNIGKVIVSFLGNNKRVHALINGGKINYELVPQGTLAERIRAAGAGLGGILTKTGIGTIVEEGKRTVEVKGEKFLLEEPLRGNVALVKAYKGDRLGNLVFGYSETTFNSVMATAADVVIAQVDHIVETGEIEPQDVQVPAIFVDYVVEV